MKAASRALVLAAFALVSAVGVLGACTSGTTPDCSGDAGSCGPLPSEGGEDASPSEAAPTDSSPADAAHAG
jgi:hypothetical protein